MALANDSKPALAENLTELLSRREEARLDLSRKMGVADGTLGRIKYGTGNPTVEVLDQIANFFKVPTWELLAPKEAKATKRAQGLDTSLLSSAVTISLRAFRKAKRSPTDDGIAAAVTFVYVHAMSGKSLKDIATLVDRELSRFTQGVTD